MLMVPAGQVMNQNNQGAVVACIRQLDHMTGTDYNSHRGYDIHRYTLRPLIFATQNGVIFVLIHR